MTRSFFEVRPSIGECPPAHQTYVDEVPEGSILDILKRQSEEFRQRLSGLSDADASFRYAPEKWSVKELVGHICDAERIFGYRALCIARGDEGPFPSFDEDKYVEGSRFHDRSFADLTTEFGLIRKLSYSFFSSLNEAEWNRRGIASNHVCTVRAIAFIVAGHLAHHLNIFEARYVPGLSGKAKS